MVDNKEDLVDSLIKENYYLNTSMINFLLVENLALKLLLNEKNIIDSDEYKKFQDKASNIVEQNFVKQMENFKKENPNICEKIKEREQSLQSTQT
jgi:hypothetical protein